MHRLGKATRIQLFNFSTVQMRTFHMTWISFFVCFIAWFATAPLMPIIRDELHLSKTQIGNIMIASMSITVLMRLLIGHLCDHFGPRLTYAWLLIGGAIPVMAIGLAQSYESFLFWRVLIGGIGASFVLTQYHTSAMFAPNVVGTANATTAGWGNLGGGVAQMIMPFIFTLLIGFGFVSADSWRLAMIFPGIALIVCGICYLRFTKDTPNGNFKEIGKKRPVRVEQAGQSEILTVLLDPRVWVLFILYGACFGIELTVNSSAALYFTDKFHLGLAEAGIVAGLHGMLNIFGRTLGGVVADRMAVRWGLRGRVWLLAASILLEGIGLWVFAKMEILSWAIALLLLFSLFVQMACGATYSIVPFINKKRLGLVSGIIGAGGNVGAVAAGFLFRLENVAVEQVFAVLGVAIILFSAMTVLLRFSPIAEARERIFLRRALEARAAS